MGQRTSEVAFGAWILMFAWSAAAQDSHPLQSGTLRVLVLNQARVRPEVLHLAEDDAEAIFAASGLQLVWLDQATAANKRFDVTVKIAAGVKPSMRPNTMIDDLSLGFAAVKATADGLRGRLAWVLFDQVEINAERHHIQISRLCGLVIAHEIGHLLLPAGHSDQGLMRATWDLRAGLLEFFSDAQADAIRSRVAYTREQGS